MKRALLILVSAALAAPASAYAAFPGGNGTIAFSREGPVPSGGIYGVEAVGMQPFQITAEAVGGDLDPAPSYSADGELIAFSRNVSASNSEVVVMSADGQNQTQITNHPGEDSDPAFSPDGSQIVVSSRVGSDLEIVLMDADGQNAVPLTSNADNDVTPSFSPDGARIVFTRLTGGGADGDIYSIRPDGQGETPIAAGPTFDRAPSFAPDGQRIAFARGSGAAAEIYVMGPNGENPTPLTSNSALDTAPAFSPDGQRIAFTQRAGGDDADVVVMDAGGGNETPLVSGLATADFGPDWQPLNPPACTVTGAAKQRSAKQVVVSVECSEDAAITATGSLRAPKPKSAASASKKKTVSLAPLALEVAANAPTTLTLTPETEKGRKLLKKALKAGKKARGSIQVAATDDLGASDADTFAVKLKKGKKK